MSTFHSKTLVIGMAIAFSITTLQSDRVMPAPACQDLPSCGAAGVIVGTQIIGGILYYLVKTASGVVYKTASRS